MLILRGRATPAALAVSTTAPMTLIATSYRKNNTFLQRNNLLSVRNNALRIEMSIM
jgi:hypothetical protein